MGITVTVDYATRGFTLGNQGESVQFAEHEAAPLAEFLRTDPDPGFTLGPRIPGDRFGKAFEDAVARRHRFTCPNCPCKACSDALADEVTSDVSIDFTGGYLFRQERSMIWVEDGELKHYIHDYSVDAGVLIDRSDYERVAEILDGLDFLTVLRG